MDADITVRKKEQKAGRAVLCAPRLFSPKTGLPWQNPGMAGRKKLTGTEVHKRIHAYCGIFKQKPGEKSVVQELLEDRRAERDRENRWEEKSKSTG